MSKTKAKPYISDPPPYPFLFLLDFKSHDVYVVMYTWRDNHGLDSFEPVTEAEVNKILKNLSKKTCSLDVVPTWLIIECADSLTTAITSIVNKIVV